MTVIVENIILVVVLLLLSVEDIKYKSISAIRLVIAVSMAVIYRLAFLELDLKLDIENIFIGVVFLAFLLVIAVAAKCIGIGDVVVLAIITVVKGSIFAINTFLIAITLIFIVSAVLLVSKKVTGKYSLPFVPYIGIGMLGVMICV